MLIQSQCPGRVPMAGNQALKDKQQQVRERRRGISCSRSSVCEGNSKNLSLSWSEGPCHEKPFMSSLGVWTFVLKAMGRLCWVPNRSAAYVKFNEEKVRKMSGDMGCTAWPGLGKPISRMKQKYDSGRNQVVIIQG